MAGSNFARIGRLQRNSRIACCQPARCLSGKARHVRFAIRPGVAELADAADSKSAGALLRVGSPPSSGTIPPFLENSSCSPFAMQVEAEFLRVPLFGGILMLDAVLKRFEEPDEV